MRSTRFARGTASALLPALALLALTGCDDDGQPVSGGTPSTSTSVASPSATLPTTPSGTITTADPAAVVIVATVANGKITPNTQTVKAEQGQRVMVTVTSDEADELHVHGYGKEVELQPGKPGSVTFTADTKGTFEIETHESGKLVAKLIVT
jgi:uncharacterized cupredoxin-like copper-binding protein